MKLITFFLLINFSANAQLTAYFGNVYNSKTREPIPFISVTNTREHKIVDADEYGKFEIEANIGDTLLITCIGFEEKYLPVAKLKIHDSIFLIEKTFELPTVSVTNLKRTNLGMVDKKQNRSYVGERNSNQFEIVKLISIPKGTGVFRIAKLNIRQKVFDENRPIRLHIYSVDEHGLPKKELLTEQVILNKKDHINLINGIDIKEQNIIVDDSSFFIGIQWLSSSENSPKNRDVGISETYEEAGLLTYRRGKVLNGRWFADYEHGMFVPFDGVNKEIDSKQLNGIEKGRPINMIASAEIEIIKNQ